MFIKGLFLSQKVWWNGDGNLYYVVNTNVKSKQINTGEWVESILYRSKIDGKFYTREKNDFYNKFIKLN